MKKLTTNPLTSEQIQKIISFIELKKNDIDFSIPGFDELTSEEYLDNTLLNSSYGNLGVDRVTKVINLTNGYKVPNELQVFIEELLSVKFHS